MDFNRAHDRLISFAVSAMITTSFLATAPVPGAMTAAAGPQPAAVMNALEGLRAAGWEGLQNAALPTPAVAPKNTPSAPTAAENFTLTDIQIQKLLKLTIDHGHDITIDQSVTAALGLTGPGESLTVRQVHVITNPQLGHAFQKAMKDDGYLFGTVYPDSFRVYRTNANQELMGAVEKHPNQVPVVIPVADAQQQLQVELAYWGTIADKF